MKNSYHFHAVIKRFQRASATQSGFFIASTILDRQWCKLCAKLVRSLAVLLLLQVKFPCKSWIYLTKYFLQYHVPVYGPFQVRKKHLQMHQHMDLNGVMNSCQVYLMIFETQQHFKVFNSIFGTYSRYGSSKNRPGAGWTVQVEEHHHIFCVGSMLYTSDPPTSVSVRKLTDLGIDFSFNITFGILEIAVRYELKKPLITRK